MGKSQARNRFGVEASYTTTSLSLKGEYIQGTGWNTDRQAAGTAWQDIIIIPQKLQVVAKYDTYDPNTSNDR